MFIIVFDFRRLLFIVTLISTFIVLTSGYLFCATQTVTSTADSGAGTLRNAITAAASGDTIDLTGVSGTIKLTSGEIAFSGDITITPDFISWEG